MTLKRTQVQKMTCMRIVDNSDLARKAAESNKKVRCIQVYKKGKYPFGNVGDRILVTVIVIAYFIIF